MNKYIRRSKFEASVEEILGTASKYRTPYNNLVIRDETGGVSILANVVNGACIGKKALGDSNVQYLEKCQFSIRL